MSNDSAPASFIYYGAKSLVTCLTILTLALTAAATFADDSAAVGRQRIAEIEAEINHLLENPAPSVKDRSEEMVRFRTLFNELTELQRKHQALVPYDGPAEVEPLLPLIEFPSIGSDVKDAELQKLMALPLVAAPKTREEALWYFGISSAHAWSALTHYFELPG